MSQIEVVRFESKLNITDPRRFEVVPICIETLASEAEARSNFLVKPITNKAVELNYALKT